MVRKRSRGVGWKVQLVDRGDVVGFSLVNPEGDVFYEQFYYRSEAPGEFALLQEAQARLSKAEQNRWIAEREQALWEKRRKLEREGLAN